MSDSATLDRIYERLYSFRVREFLRIIPKDYLATPLGAVPVPSRFSDPDLTYAVLYGAQTLACGFCEAVLRDQLDYKKTRCLPRRFIEDRHVVTFHAAEKLYLVDLRGDAAVKMGAPTGVAHDTLHAEGQKFSSLVYHLIASADGIVYDSRFTGDACICIFDKRFPQLAIDRVLPLKSHRDIYDILDAYGITLISG